MHVNYARARKFVYFARLSIFMRRDISRAAVMAKYAESWTGVRIHFGQFAHRMKRGIYGSRAQVTHARGTTDDDIRGHDHYSRKP